MRWKDNDVFDVFDRFNMLPFVYPRFSQMNIRDPQARIFMNFYADGKDKISAHRHDFWTCLLLPHPFISVWSEFLRMLVNYLRTDNIHRGCPLVRIVFWRWTDGQCCCEMAIWSFLVLKIMECLPCRMLSQESSKLSICITWRPPRPDITDGRVSLVIFFYPDADNLERQWQTINEDDEEEKTYADVSWLMWVHKKHKWMMSWLDWLSW